MLLEDNEKFIRLRFLESNKTLQGDWLIRYLSTGDVLFWKPFPTVAVMPTKNIEVVKREGDILSTVEQRFSIFSVTTEDNNFEGIAMAEGVWTGDDWHTTLFTGSLIESLGQQMQSDMENQLVDYNHDFVSGGRLTEVELREERGLKYIYTKGIGDKPIPLGSGLSLLIKSNLKWNSNLNVWIPTDVSAHGVSIMTERSPACTICMIK